MFKLRFEKQMRPPFLFAQSICLAKENLDEIEHF